MPTLRRTLLSAFALAAAGAPTALRAQGSLAAGAHVATAPVAPPRTAAPAARALRLAPLLLAHRVDLGIDAVQATRLAAIANRLDLVVSPLEAEIDSLTLRGDAIDWSRVDAAQGAILRDQTRKRSALVAAVHDELMLARTQTLDVLTETQQRAAAELEAAQRKADMERLRMARGGGWNGVNQVP